MIRKALIVAGLVVALPSPSEALFCPSKPRAPYCADQFGQFDDQREFDRCRDEMESYKSRVQSYADCQRQMIDDATREFNSAVASFNRRARRY
ncbi:MAG: hypothetical protein K2Y27_19155 [Xanthobacteraceae bacterium]|nr:hypothetical protein [Xanthobacteraceae bacterium]